MIAAPPDTLLEKLDALLAIDADTMDAAFIKALPITPHDMTSNPRFVHEQLAHEDNKPLVAKVIAESPYASFEEIYSRVVAQLSAKVIPHISGRVLAQVLPSQSYDKQEIIDQARRYQKGYSAVGISNDRFCIKLPLTGPAIEAAVELKKENIATLGTCLFSVHQGLAASQAGMHAVSMYFNEPLAGADATVWPDLANPKSEHPMAARHMRLRILYDHLKNTTGKEQPQIKTASFVNGREVVAMVSLGADHVTLGKPTLEDLVAGPSLPKYASGLWKVPVSEQFSKSGFGWEDWVNPPTRVTREMLAIAKEDRYSPNSDTWLEDAISRDYTTAAALDAANEKDEITKTRLKVALQRFGVFEAESRKYVAALKGEISR